MTALARWDPLGGGATSQPEATEVRSWKGHAASGGGAICARNSMDRRSESAVAPGERAFYAFDHERCCESWEQKPLVPYEHVVVDPLHAALNEIGEALELFREHRDREPVRVTK